jgi:hypothetical protein
MTRVVNIRHERCDVYIGRAGHGSDGYFGNPFRLEAGEPRGATIERYRKWFHERLETNHEFKRRIRELKDKTLGCFCKPAPCHGDVIGEYLDGTDDELATKEMERRSGPLAITETECETVEVLLSPQTTPVAYWRKVRCLMYSGMSRREAEESVSDTPVILELFYDTGRGLFAVESEAVLDTAIYNPYTGEEIPESE